MTCPTSELLSVSEAARLLNVPARTISDALYQGAVPNGDELAPIVAGRRLIAATAIPVIAYTLRCLGKRPIIDF